MADAVLISMIDSATLGQVRALEWTIGELHPGATVFLCREPGHGRPAGGARGPNVLVVEDGPTSGA